MGPRGGRGLALVSLSLSFFPFFLSRCTPEGVDMGILLLQSGPQSHRSSSQRHQNPHTNSKPPTP